jgi:predicted amino acid racemase
MRIVADCTRIRRNAEAVVDLCSRHGISVAGVTKCVCGKPEIARAMLAGGCSMLADSRLDNIERLRAAGIDVDVLLLRIPAISTASDVVRLAQYSLVSEVETARALSAAAVAQGCTHGVLLMVETGDRREGVTPEKAEVTARSIRKLPGLELAGMATALNCLCGMLPTAQTQQEFANLVERVETALGHQMRLVSGGHSGDLHLLQAGVTPPRINQFRVGEAILCGTDFSTFADLPMPHTDTFTVFSEVIEVMDKQSAPAGPCGPDAFMRVCEWPDRGLRRRAILDLGEIDLSTASLKPRREGVELVGASSDHLVVDVTEASPPVRLGEELEFGTLYPAVCTGWSSRCCERVVLAEDGLIVSDERTTS